MVASYFNRLGFQIENIVSPAENWSFDKTISVLCDEMEREEARFRRKHPGVGEIHLLGEADSDFEVFMDCFFRSKGTPQERALKYGNLKIGYAEGELQND